jgi:hypothetical protein
MLCVQQDNIPHLLHKAPLEEIIVPYLVKSSPIFMELHDSPSCLQQSVTRLVILDLPNLVIHWLLL